jgi:two-component system, OmpR family, osmolarity sensor histidine kinase EnvZ
MSRWWPATLFGRTALLIASTLAIFTLLAWAAIVWTTVIPAARATADFLALRSHTAVASYKNGTPLPEGVTVVAGPPPSRVRRPSVFALSFYMINLRAKLRADLPGAEVLVSRSAMPSELWVQMPDLPGQWLILYWRVARPETPAALMGVFLLGASLTLVGGAVFAQRLTSPLAALVTATRHVAQGERVKIDTQSGPIEVRTLAESFQAMTHRLAELDEQRELMLAGLSHDLRSPLARIRVALELLDPRDAALARQMIVEVEEIDTTVGQFLHYVRAGYAEPPALVSVDEVIRATLAHYVAERQLLLELNAGRPCQITVEALRHVLLNLVQNAFEYGAPPVNVRSELTPSSLRLSVEDHGAGLSPKEWQEALRPFKRLRTTPGSGHTGLGLAMVDRLVRACGGNMASRRESGKFIIAVELTASVPK